MKKRYQFLFYFIAAFIFSSLNASAGDSIPLFKSGEEPPHRLAFTDDELEYIKEKKKIIMCIDPDWMPYEKLDSGDKYIGIAADYHKIVSSLTGLGYEILRTGSWAETLKAAREGKCDILSVLNDTPDRKNI